jgi:copper chaperone NosL
MSTPLVSIVVFALLSSACGAKRMGPPEIAVDRTACSHCGMFVSEPVYAAAYQAAAHEPRVFDDIGCMLNAVRRETASPITFWLQDAAGGGWVGADEAFILVSSRLQTPMSGGVIAFADKAAAQHAASKHGGRVVQSLDGLLADGGAK